MTSVVNPTHRTIRIRSPLQQPSSEESLSIQGFHPAESAPLFFSCVYQHRAGHLIRRSHAKGINPRSRRFFVFPLVRTPFWVALLVKMPAWWNPVKLANQFTVNI